MKEIRKERFGKIFEIPFQGTSYISEKPNGLKNFKRSITLNSLVTNPMVEKKLPLRATLLNSKVRILHYLLIRILLPRNTNKQLCYKRWHYFHLASHTKHTNKLGRGIFHHMSLSKEKPLTYIPYGAMITTILKIFKVYTLGEKSISSNNMMNYTNLRDMKINIRCEELIDDWINEEEESG